VNLLKLAVSAVQTVFRKLYIPALVTLAGIATTPGSAAAGEYLRLKVLVIVYTNTFAGSVTSSEVENVRREVDEAVEFIWRSSRMRLHLVVDDLTLHDYVPEDHFIQPKPGRYVLPYWTRDGASGSVVDDLADFGYASDSYDIVVAFYAFEPGPERRNHFGAGSYGVDSVLGKAGYITIPMTWAPKTFNDYFEHEFLHILSDIFREGGSDTDLPLLHNGDFFEFLNGKDVSYEKWMLDGLTDADYTGKSRRWGTVQGFKDRDGDGVPDYSPYGDDLRITEETLGSSTSEPDTDGDGLSDLEEAIAGARSGTDPNDPDTDGDGLLDGDDPDPLKASGAEAQ
jgi:hypothetical protein